MPNDNVNPGAPISPWVDSPKPVAKPKGAVKKKVAAPPLKDLDAIYGQWKAIGGANGPVVLGEHAAQGVDYAYLKMPALANVPTDQPVVPPGLKPYIFEEEGIHFLADNPDNHKPMRGNILRFGGPAVAPEPAKPQPPKLPDLYTFVQTDQPFEGTIWTFDAITDAIIHQGWRERAAGETILKGDIVRDEVYERVQGLEGVVLTAEDMKALGHAVFTLEGGGKPTKPIVLRTTDEFTSIYEVPKGAKVKLPTNVTEAARFFGCDVISTQILERGKMTKVFYPMPTKMVNRRFRQAFSRVFSDFCKNHFRSCIQSVIPGRGQGFNINRYRPSGTKKGISPRTIRKMLAERGIFVNKTWIPMTTDQIYGHIYEKYRLHKDDIQSLVQRYDYQPLNHKTDHGPFDLFIERMNGRALSPDVYRYEKAIGIEIEVVSPLPAAAMKLPNNVRAVYDGSLRNDEGIKMCMTGGNEQKDLATGRDGKWGVEFQILVKRSECEVQLRRAFQFIGTLGCHVNKSCGMHVHFDMRDKTYDEVILLAQKVNAWLMIMKELIPAARRDNTNCSFENPDREHHAAVATDCYRKHKTMEVRVHSSTLMLTKIVQWIRLVERVIEMPYVLPGKTPCLDALKALELPPSDHQYWVARHHMLNPKLYDSPADLSFLNNQVELE